MSQTDFSFLCAGFGWLAFLKENDMKKLSVNFIAKFSKRIIALIIVCVTAFSILFSTGCNNNANQNGSGATIESSGNNGETQNNNGENQNNNGENQNNDGENQNNNDSKYANYSQILRNILEDKNYIYTALIGADLTASQIDYAYNNPEYQAIPYGFLENEGFDITKIKNKELYCYSELYSIENDLFIELKVEVKASTNYLNCYLLKYTLTNQELNEIQKLFKEISSNMGLKTYYQAPFFVQELSYLKAPEIVSLAYITKRTNDGAIAYFNKKKFVANLHKALYLGSEYVENSQTAYHLYQIRPNSIGAKVSTKLGVIKIYTNGYGRLQLNDLIIHNSTNLELSGKIKTQDRENFETNIKNITAYASSNHYFQDIKYKGDIEKIFGN